MEIFSRKSKGFTLIELLVVIAIIGILASIVLVSLGSARTKAKDAKIQAALTQVRSFAEMIQVDADSYASLCSGTTLATSTNTSYGTSLNTLSSEITTLNSAAAIKCYGTSTDYCVSAKLLNGNYQCISSNGRTGNDTCAAATDCAP